AVAECLAGRRLLRLLGDPDQQTLLASRTSCLRPSGIFTRGGALSAARLVTRACHGRLLRFGVAVAATPSSGPPRAPNLSDNRWTYGGAACDTKVERHREGSVVTVSRRTDTVN